MTLHLAIDTATEPGSVAVGSPGAVRVDVTVPPRATASDLLPAVLDAIDRSGTDPAHLAGVVVADGPGSFTGLRIGFSTAKAFLRARDGMELRLAPSLLASAFSVRAMARGAVAALYDALRGEVYAAVYEFDDRQVHTHLPPTCVGLAELAARCAAVPVLAVGDGARAHGAFVRDWTGRVPASPSGGTSRAAALLDLLAWDGGTIVVADPATAEPLYGRPAEAQARWERKHGRPLSHPDAPAV